MTRKKPKKKGTKLPARELQREILRLFKRSPKKRYNPKQISKKLQIGNNKDSIQHALEELASTNQIVPLEDYKYKLRGTTAPSRAKKLLEGRVDMTRKGSAYIICEDIEDDVHVAAKNLNSALNGDIVKIAYWRPSGRRKMEGEVVKVVKRAADHFMGTLWMQRRHAMVVPDKINMPVNIFVDLPDINNAKEGEKVIVKITHWHPRTPKGIVTAVLGESGSSDIEMKSILINNGFQLDFPEEVLQETEHLQEEITTAEVARRRDMRDVPTFTIDPADAKDFDDALSFQYLENGDLEIGVHIADVTHYVKPGTALDNEALERSTSVYLVDRVLPMLPEKLSNGLCSLRPNEDKCTFSAVFAFDKNDKIVSRWFGKTLIHSNKRFAYEDAQEIIDSGEGEFADELKILNKLSKKLKTERFKKGSIDFETEEVRFKLDENGVPVDVFIKERKEAHMLIEDFMLLANKEVAAFIQEKAMGQEIPFIYRIHDEPNPDKIADLARFAKEMGFEMNVSTPQEIARSFNKLSKAAREDDSLMLLSPIAIRTMSKAAYSTENIGHYGLGFENYSHFTSPIRRYSDVLAHRILELNLEDKVQRVSKEKLEEKCKHISIMERRAMDAERESIKYKQVEFMEKHKGEVFEGFISGMIDRGIFVELKNSKCEGMVGFETMDEPFEVEDGRLRAKGIYTKTVLKMGDLVKVKIVDTDMARRQIVMELV